MKKRIISAICLIIMLASLVSCTGGGNYKTDVPVSELSDAAIKTVSLEKGYLDGDEDVFDEYFGAPSYVDSYSIKISRDSQNYNEFGIFRLKDSGKAKAMKGEINEYLTKRKNNKQQNDYFPNEVPKLNAAEIKIYGSYVVYAIIPSSQKTAFFGAIEELLTK